MIESDTIKLLRECDSGIKMGIESIDEVLPRVQNHKFKTILEECKRRHSHLGKEIEELLHFYHDEGKEPPLMTRAMSWAKTNMKMAMECSDENIAALMSEGCGMGIRSVYKYFHQYENANEDAKDAAKSLAKLEEKLVDEKKEFL